MELSEAELRMIERLRKQERGWHFTRWVILCIGFVAFGLSVTGLLTVAPYLQQASDGRTETAVLALFTLALLHPPILAFALVAVCAFYFTIRSWKGDSTRTLLLRLIDDRTRVTDDHVG